MDYHITFSHLSFIPLMGILLSFFCVCARPILDCGILPDFQILVIYFSSMPPRSLVDVGRLEALVARCSATAGGLVLPGKLH